MYICSLYFLYFIHIFSVNSSFMYMYEVTMSRCMAPGQCCYESVGTGEATMNGLRVHF